MAAQLPDIYKSLGIDYDERVLPSIVNEILKATVVSTSSFSIIVLEKNSLFFFLSTVSYQWSNLNGINCMEVVKIRMGKSISGHGKQM